MKSSSFSAEGDVVCDRHTEESIGGYLYNLIIDHWSGVESYKMFNKYNRKFIPKGKYRRLVRSLGFRERSLLGKPDVRQFVKQ